MFFRIHFFCPWIYGILHFKNFTQCVNQSFYEKVHFIVILLLFYCHSRKLIKVLLLAFADDKMLTQNKMKQYKHKCHTNKLLW